MVATNKIILYSLFTPPKKAYLFDFEYKKIINKYISCEI